MVSMNDPAVPENVFTVAEPMSQSLHQPCHKFETIQNRNSTQISNANGCSDNLTKVASYIDPDDHRNNLSFMKLPGSNTNVPLNSSDPNTQDVPTIPISSLDSPRFTCRECQTQSVFSYDNSGQRVKKYFFCPKHNLRFEEVSKNISSRPCMVSGPNRSLYMLLYSNQSLPENQVMFIYSIVFLFLYIRTW